MKKRQPEKQFPFSGNLLEWHDPAARNLPWKKTKDAYKIWLSEIILQQTRVEQGTPYYLAFVKQFPTVKALSDAPLDDILKLWEGLGYYSRARNLHEAAKQIVAIHKGKFPQSYEEIRALKGIGNYTAAAIASFAYNLPYAVLDGNVYRVLSRVFGIETPVDSSAGKKRFELLAAQLLDKKNPAAYNQAIMDFGALVCKPKQPLCGNCPFSSVCKALATDRIALLPVKSKQLVKKERYFNYFVLYDATSILIRQRTDKDIWKGLFEFPAEESDSRSSIVSSDLLKQLKHRLSAKNDGLVYRQTLSHQYINGYFYEIRFKKLPKLTESFLKIPKSTIYDYAFPKIIRQYLEDRFIFLT